MNKLMLAIKRRLQWKLLAITDAPFTERRPTDKQLKEHLESLSIGEQLRLMAIVKILSWIDKGAKIK